MGRGASKNASGGGNSTRNARNGITRDFPELQGSEKQIKWATDIRAQKAQKFSEYFGFVNKSMKDGSATILANDDTSGTVEMHKYIANQLLTGRTDANYWIDHRNDTVYSMIERYISGGLPSRKRDLKARFGEKAFRREIISMYHEDDKKWR